VAGQLLCEAGRPGDALAQYRALLAREPRHPEALLCLGRAALTARQPVVAETAFRQALLTADAEATAEAARRGLLHGLVAQSRHAEAEAVAAELLALRPDDAALWRLRGQLRLAREQTEAAAAAYECAWRLGDRSDETRLTLAELHMAGERAAEARALLAGYVPGSEAASNRVERLRRAMPQD
jgi:predicted Zn-dependent protease